MHIIGRILSPFVMRAILVGRLKGQEIATQDPPADWPGSAEFFRINPTGKVPVLVEGEMLLPESSAIAEYLEETLEGPSVLPGSAEDRARARMLSALSDNYVVPALMPLLRTPDQPEITTRACADMASALRHIEILRPKDAIWLAGDAPTLADCALMPLVFFLRALDARFGTEQMLLQLPGLAGWWNSVQKSDLGNLMLQQMSAAWEARRSAR